MKLLRTVAIGATVSALLLSAACGGSGNEVPGESGGSSTVTVNYLPILSMAPLFVAEEKGFFADRGITNEFSTADIYSRLAVQAQGELDVNIPGVGGAFFNAINQGLDLRAVADRQQYRCTSDNLLLVRQDLYDQGVTSPEDLAGKKVAIIARGSTTEYWLDKLLESVDITQDDLGEIVTLSYPDTVNALRTGAVDAGFLVEPLAYQLLQDGTAERIIAMHEIVPDQEQGLITMSGQFIDENPDVAAAWLAAWVEGVRYYSDPANQDEVVDIISQWTEVPVEQIAPLYGTDQWAYANPNGFVDTDTVVDQDGQWLLDNGVIEELPDVETWYDDGPITQAIDELGEVDATRSCDSVPELET